MKIVEKKLEDLKPFEKNAKLHDKKQIALLKANIQKFGFTTPLLISDDNEIIAGHGRLMAVKELDYKTVPCVLMSGLTKEEISALRLADNQINALTGFDMKLVIEELKGLSSEMLDLTGFDKDLIIEPDEADDIIPENVPARSKLGDLYELGSHRVLCGDSTQPEAVLRLMGGVKADMCFCDPPYNVNYTGGMGTHEKNDREGIENDNMSREAFKEFLTKAMLSVVSNTEGAIYVCMSSSELGSLREAFEKAGGHWQSFIMWVKNNFTLSRADYQNTYEPILYGWREGIVNHYFSDRRDIANVWEDLREVKTEYDGKETTISFQGFKVKLQGKIEKGEVIRKKQSVDIWRYDKPIKSELHPTQKPVVLIVEAITNSSKREEIVLDSFLGSGSTLIACEKTGRICYGMELSEKYCDVIVQRYVDYTGNEDIKLNGKEIKWKKTDKKPIKD